MQCPKCGSNALKVIDSRDATGNTIRRRRQCLNDDCKYTFTTYESALHIDKNKKQAKYSPLLGTTYTRQDLFNRIFTICFSAGIKLEEAQKVLVRAESIAKGSLGSLSNEQMDLCILKSLSDTKFSYFVAYAVGRFKINNVEQISALWNLHTELTMEAIQALDSDSLPAERNDGDSYNDQPDEDSDVDSEVNDN